MSLFKIIGGFTLTAILGWLAFTLRGKQFALRDNLRKADAIVVLAGTRGNINFLNGKIQTAVKLFKQGWAPCIIFSGKFSVKVTDTPKLIPAEELQVAAAHGRIQEKDVSAAAQTWDEGLGAVYMRDEAIALGVPQAATLIENEALHTRENAEHVAQMLEAHGMKRIILVTSPFHQLRTYLTFAKVLQPKGIEIINYYADTGEWHPLTWFLSAEHRRLVSSEIERIQTYRKKGDLL
jgi:uncharacterized SAM-binding protein YcdF (DUF218 family)